MIEELDATFCLISSVIVDRCTKGKRTGSVCSDDVNEPLLPVPKLSMVTERQSQGRTPIHSILYANNVRHIIASTFYTQPQMLIQD